MIRGEGNPRIAMLSMLISVLLNVILAPIFIFVFHWGMKGAALATVLSQAVSAVWVLAYFSQRRPACSVSTPQFPPRLVDLPRHLRDRLAALRSCNWPPAPCRAF